MAERLSQAIQKWDEYNDDRPPLTITPSLDPFARPIDRLAADQQSQAERYRRIEEHQTSKTASVPAPEIPIEVPLYKFTSLEEVRSYLESF